MSNPKPSVIQPKPYSLYGEPTAETVERLDEMLGILFAEVLSISGGQSQAQVLARVSLRG